jgi:hypothetical protein
MKTIIKPMIILITLIFLIGIMVANKQDSNIKEFIQESELERIVTEAISGYASSNQSVKAVFESHIIVGTELKMYTLSVYAIGYVKGVYANGQGFGGEYPAHIKIQKDGNSYKVVGYKDAVASMDIYDIMPRKYAKAILNNGTSSLREVVMREFKEWENEER